MQIRGNRDGDTAVIEVWGTLVHSTLSDLQMKKWLPGTWVTCSYKVSGIAGAGTLGPCYPALPEKRAGHIHLSLVITTNNSTHSRTVIICQTWFQACYIYYYSFLTITLWSGLLLSPFYRWESWDTEPKSTQVISGGTRSWTQAGKLQRLSS